MKEQGLEHELESPDPQVQTAYVDQFVKDQRFEMPDRQTAERRQRHQHRRAPATGHDRAGRRARRLSGCLIPPKS